MSPALMLADYFFLALYQEFGNAGVSPEEGRRAILDNVSRFIETDAKVGSFTEGKDYLGNVQESLSSLSLMLAHRIKEKAGMNAVVSVLVAERPSENITND